jgi:hypothetical protein
MRLNTTAYEHAQRLIGQREVVFDQRDDWSEHRPSTAQENAYIRDHGIQAYARWYLGVDEAQDQDNKGRYKFPYGDFQKVHRCGVLSAESRAGQYKHFEVVRATAHLHGMLDALMRVEQQTPAGGGRSA